MQHNPNAHFNRLIDKHSALVRQHIFPGLSLDDVVHLGRTCKSFHRQLGEYLKGKCSFAPCVAAIENLARIFIPGHDDTAPKQDSAPKTPFAEHSYGWACEVFNRIAARRPGLLSAELRARREMGDLTHSILSIAKDSIRRRLQTRVKPTERETACILEFVIAWVHYYPFDSQTLYTSRYAGRALHELIYYYTQTVEGIDRTLDELFPIVGRVSDLSHKYLPEIQQQWFLYNLFFTLLLGLGNIIPFRTEAIFGRMFDTFKGHSTPVLFGNFLSLWKEVFGGKSKLDQSLTPEEIDSYNQLVSAQLREFVKKLDVPDKVKERIRKTGKIPLMEELLQAINERLSVPDKVKERIRKTGKIPSMDEVWGRIIERLNFSDEVKAHILRTGEVPPLNDQLAKSIRELHISEEMRACLEGGTIPLLDDQLVAIVEELHVPDAVKTRILEKREVPYGWSDEPLQGKVLVSMRKESRNHPLPWGILGPLYTLVDVESLLSEALPVEVLVQFSVAENRLNRMMPPQSLVVPTCFQERFSLIIQRNERVFEVWRPYLENPALFLYHGSALRAIFNMLYVPVVHGTGECNYFSVGSKESPLLAPTFWGEEEGDFVF